MASELVRELVSAGIHFGHRVSRWNPKMEPYIFGRRNMIHIIDVRETIKGLIRAKKFITREVAQGREVLFVGTKRQARHAITSNAESVKMPYVIRRWLGGTLTNFRTIRSRLGRLEELETELGGEVESRLSKKATSALNRQLRKIKSNLEGIRQMEKLPGALFVVDVRREHLAVREAKKLGIPTVCLIDTDSDPDFADIPIPGNDDSMRSIETILRHISQAIEEGLRARTAGGPATEESRFHRRSSRATTSRTAPSPEDAEQPTAESAGQPSEAAEQLDQGSDDSSSQLPAMREG